MSNSFTSVFGAGGGGGTDATKLPLTGGTLTGNLVGPLFIATDGAYSESELRGNSLSFSNSDSVSSISLFPSGIGSNVEVMLPSVNGTLVTTAGGTLTGILTMPNAGLVGLSLTGSQATNTLNVSTTWNTTGNPALIYGRVNNTASGASANLLDLGTTAAGTLIKITKTGVISGPTNYLTLGTDPRIAQQNTGRPIELSTTQGYTNIFDTIPRLGFSTTAGNTAPNECISRVAAFTYQFGLNTASTPNAQTIKAHDVTTGVGANLILSGGTGSGGQNGVVIISRLPTSNPGPGILWNNAGTPAIGT